MLKANSRHEFPLAFVVHDENNKLVATAELKIRENIDFPEYEHWLGGVYVEDSARGKGYAAALVLKTMFLSLVLPKCSYNANNIMKLYIGNMAFDLYITLYITTFKLPLWFGSNLS
ncbi:GNAT family N-acetyltransferase [Vibrio campbellii]|uniref:GNAT family N-acetyltransferase n=1 Tax=Vibrio campbellii TaxID=680 RepID=UPI00210C97A3|nr:GNAT family N-acetyltransferase [Vibrio campbellii]